MDILIPLGRGSQWNDNELRYALRGVQKFLSGVDQVFVVGEKPDWLTGVIHIPWQDTPGGSNRDLNIYNKILAGCRDERLSDNFLFMSDDHFLITHYGAGTFPFLYKGDLLQSIVHYSDKMPYKKVLTNTFEFLTKIGRPTCNFQIHCPIIYNKAKFLNAPVGPPWPNYGFVVKSLYCNYYGIKGIFYTDLKLKESMTIEEIHEKLNDRAFFSIGNKALDDNLKSVLEELYPVKSKYEI